jgi:hypothetical protein
MGNIPMMQLRSERAATTPALRRSMTLLVDARGGFDGIGAPAAGGVISGLATRRRFAGKVAPVMGAMSAQRVDRDVPSHSKSSFAGGARRSVFSRPPV